jgi:acyl-coenzyme A thioesterase PaaI-like protein
MSRVPTTTPPSGAVIPERHPESPATGSELPSHFKHCFGCGDLHPTVTENHQGAPGLAHGGLLSLAFDEALGKLMWLLRAPAVTARLETDFLMPVPIGTTLYITAEIVGQHGRKVYSVAEGRLNAPDGPIATRASSLFIIVPMNHFLDNAPAEYIAAIRSNPELMSFVDPEFNINP